MEFQGKVVEYGDVLDLGLLSEFAIQLYTMILVNAITIKHNQMTQTSKSNLGNSKFSFYKLPSDLLEQSKKGTQLVEEEIAEHLIEEDQLSSSTTLNDCVVHGHSTVAYQCGNPPVTKYGNCDIYYANVNGQWQYCYTRCESAYIVCNRP